MHQIISGANPIRIYPDGDMWCAVAGADLQEGASVWGKTPIEALKRLQYVLTPFEECWIMLDLPLDKTPLPCP